MAIGARLQVARRAIGFTQGEVGARMGMATSTVSAIEAGKRSVTGPELYQLARIYQRPLSFFFESNEVGGAPGFQYLFREASEKALDRASVVKLEELDSDYRELEKLTGVAPLPPPPDYSRFGLEREQDAETLAEMERSRLGLGDAPLKDVMDFLDGTVGVPCFLVPVLGKTWSGVAVRSGQERSCVAANSRDYVYRRNWSLTHEYAHVLVHLRREGSPEANLDIDTEGVQTTPEERFANAFAAAFLMPRRAVLAQFERARAENAGRFTDFDLARIAMQFGVSGQAVSARLVGLRKLPRDTHRRYWDQHSFKELAEALGFHVDDDVHKPPAILPARFRSLAWKAYRDEKISLSKLAELLRQDFYELQVKVESLEAAAAEAKPVG